MEVYRITLRKFADQLFAPGKAGRWNREGQYVIYAAQSRSLACLENLVHRRGTALRADYRIMVIHIPDTLGIQRVELATLPENWQTEVDAQHCQQIGGQWYQEVSQSKRPAAILSVPSAIMPAERNAVLHTRHPAFSRIQLLGTESFRFDPRLIDR